MGDGPKHKREGGVAGEEGRGTGRNTSVTTEGQAVRRVGGWKPSTGPAPDQRWRFEAPRPECHCEAPVWKCPRRKAVRWEGLRGWSRGMGNTA